MMRFTVLLLLTFFHWSMVGFSQTPDTTAIPTKAVLIKTKEDLIKFAEPRLFKIYGEEEIIGERPYRITFKKGIWTMKGTLPSGYDVGGTFLIIVSARDGTIRKLTHGK